MEHLEVILGLALEGLNLVHKRPHVAVFVEQLRDCVLALLKRLVIHNIIDPEPDLAKQQLLCSVVLLLANKANELLECQRLRVQLTIQDLLDVLEVVRDVLHVRKHLALAAREHAVAEDAADTIQLRLHEAGELDILATLVVIVGQHRQDCLMCGH